MAEKKSSVGTFINEKILPSVMKFVNTKAVVALKDGMDYALPFIIIGSIFLILKSFPIPAVSTFFDNIGWSVFFNQAYQTTFAIISIWTAVGIAYVYAKNEKLEPLPVGLTSLSVFFLLQKLQVDAPLVGAMAKGGSGITDAAGKTLYTSSQLAHQISQLPDAIQTYLKSPVTNVINMTWLGGQGMIAAIICGLLVGWTYTLMAKAGWEIKLPEQVPANVANQFSAMIPSGVIITVAMVIYAIFDKALNTDLLNWIYKTLQIPLQGLSDSLGGGIILAFMVVFFWFFGVHGGLIMGGIGGAFLLPNSADNARLLAEGKLSLENGAHIVTNEFYNNFINLTGSGITIGLVIFTLVGAKSVQFKSIGKVELVPALFNINEPFLFGLPLVMNPWLAIPFFLTPVVVALSTYLVIKFGIVPPTGVAAPWTTPAVISGFFIGGWKMALWQACVLAISTAIYWPFAVKYDKYLKEQEDANAATDAQ